MFDVIGCLLLYFQLDIGFCFYGISTLVYWIIFPPVLYRTVKQDSIYCRENSIYETPEVTQGLVQNDQVQYNYSMKTIDNNFLPNNQIFFEDEEILVDQLTISLEWKVNFEDLKFSKRIGVGGAGEVYKGTWKGTVVAVKKIFKEITNEEKKPILKELDIMKVKIFFYYFYYFYF